MPFNKRVTDLVGVELPIIQAPMAGSSDAELAIAVSEAGGLGSLPCAMLNADQVRTSYETMRQRTARPLNLNFFCHRVPPADHERERRWRELLGRYYAELGLDSAASVPVPTRTPFDDVMCDVTVELKPAVVSFHFGLPAKPLLERLRACGARIISSATTVEEARWLEGEGCDAVIEQGSEAGGHRGMFLATDVATQVGTIALTPQIVDAVKIPVIAAGGANRHGVPALSGIPRVGCASKGDSTGARRSNSPDECHHGPAGSRHRESHYSRCRTNERGRAAVSTCRRCFGGFASNIGTERIRRLFSALVRPVRSDVSGPSRGRADENARKRRARVNEATRSVIAREYCFGLPSGIGNSSFSKPFLEGPMPSRAARHFVFTIVLLICTANLFGADD